MCHERERLIGYIYDECDPQERLQIESHLIGCPGCREELGDLRAVRQDLLAWDVPEHGSVWRPFAPPQPRFSWRDVPAWAMAAAAGVIFFAGAAGGVATRALWPASPAPVVGATIDAATSPTMTAANLAAIETRVIEQIRAELAARPVPASSPATRTADEKRLAEQIASLEREYLEWSSIMIRVQNDVLGLKKARATAYERPDPPGAIVPANFIR